MKTVQYCYFLLCLLFTISSSANQDDNPRAEPRSWRGLALRLGLGGNFDFELDLKKGDGQASSALFRYGIEYGYQFRNSHFFIAGALDWTIVYPRNFTFRGNKPDFFKPPISLWYNPVTDVKMGWAFNEKWLATIGSAYLWGLTNSLRYRANDALFVETSTIVWMDRVFDTKGYYGHGFDNFQWTCGIGFIF
jgi:hypothetical protein